MVRARWAAARLAGALLRGGEPAGESQNGATGLKNERILAREDLRTMRNPPVHLEQGSQVWTGLAMARGGLRGTGLPSLDRAPKFGQGIAGTGRAGRLGVWLWVKKARGVSVEQGQVRARDVRDWVGLQDARHSEISAVSI